MVAINKIIGVMSCGFVLCLGLTGNAASAADKIKADQSSERLGGQAGLESDEGKLKGAIVERDKTLQGEVLRVEGPNYFVKGKDGKEVRLHTDSTTLMMTGIIGKGDRVEALVNEQNHALSINKTSMKN